MDSESISQIVPANPWTRRKVVTNFRTVLHPSVKEEGENNDCVVRALSLVHNMPYDAAHARLAGLGRKPRKGFRTRMHSDKLGLEEVEELCRKRLSTVLPSLRSGRFLLVIRNHALAVVDGKVYNGCRLPERTIVKAVYRPVVWPVVPKQP